MPRWTNSLADEAWTKKESHEDFGLQSISNINSDNNNNFNSSNFCKNATQDWILFEREFTLELART